MLFWIWSVPDNTPEAAFPELSFTFFLDIRQERHVLPPTHLRVLGFRLEASDLLSEIKKKSRLPLITKAAGHPELSEEIRISSLYHLGNSYNELSRPLVIL